MMLAGAAFAVGCALSAAAPGIALFLAGRVLQGCAAGWIGGLIYVALALLFPGRHLPRAFALCTSVWGIATFAGPLLGGLFADAGHVARACSGCSPARPFCSPPPASC